MRDTSFIFDGIKSDRYGLHIVKVEEGLFEQSVAGGKEIIEELVKNKRNPYFYGITHHPLEFTITFSLLDKEMTPERKYELMRWLIKDDYATFQTTDDLTKSIDIIAISPIIFMNNGIDQGYFTVEYRASTSHWWTAYYNDIFDLSENEYVTEITIENRSNVGQYYYPEVQFELVGDSRSVEIVNVSDKGREFSFTGLESGEVIYVNNELRQIQSTSEMYPYRLGNFNKNWLRLVYGVNRLQVKGKCHLKFR